MRVEPAVITTDPTRVRQIVRNLVSNAIKHGGPTVWITGALRGRDYLLVVADDGEGIGPEASRDLFEPFAHSGEEAVLSGSVGLGLAVARQLARRLEGDLVYQRTDGWTQFLLHLPAEGEPDPSTAEAALLEVR